MRHSASGSVRNERAEAEQDEEGYDLEECTDSVHLLLILAITSRLRSNSWARWNVWATLVDTTAAIAPPY